MPTVLTIKGANNANDEIHTARDTLDRINFDLALQALRMNTALVATALQAGQTRTQRSEVRGEPLAFGGATVRRDSRPGNSRGCWVASTTEATASAQCQVRC